MHGSRSTIGSYDHEERKRVQDQKLLKRDEIEDNAYGIARSRAVAPENSSHISCRPPRTYGA